MTTATDEILSVLSRADRRWATRHEMVESEAEYLQHLTRAVAAHIAGKTVGRTALLRSLVSAVLVEDFDPNAELADQAEEAVRIVGEIHTYLLSLNSRSRAAHRPVEGAA